MLTTDQKGAIAETAIVHSAVKLGIGVWSPHTVERSDLIFDLRDRLVRVQCKWANRYGDVIIVRCYSNTRTREGSRRGLYSATDVDAFAAYCAELDRCYFIPIQHMDGRSTLQLRLGATRTISAIESTGPRISSSPLHCRPPLGP